jgi:hypothetical protein
MSKLEYSIYGKPGCKFSLDIPEDLEKIGYFEILKAMGYEKKDIGAPYSYNETNELAELLRFSKEGVGTIIELWDWSESLFSFFCENEQSELDVTERLISIMKNLFSVEYMGKKINLLDMEDSL